MGIDMLLVGCMRFCRAYTLAPFWCVFIVLHGQFVHAAGNPTSLQSGAGNTNAMQPVQQLQTGQTVSPSAPLSAQITIEQALDQTIMTGPRAAAARSLMAMSQAALTQARVLPNPAIEFDNGFAELSYRVGVALPIEPPWKMVFRLSAARAQINEASIQMQQALWLLRADVRRAYVELVVSQESRTMMLELSRLTNQLADVAKKRYLAGEVPKLDMLKSELAAVQSGIDADQESRRVQQAREQLNIIMGRNETAEISVPSLAPFQLKAGAANSLLPELGKPMRPASEYVNEALQERLEIKLIKQQMVTTAANRKVVVGNIIPNGQIGVGFDRQLNPSPETNVDRWYLMGSFPMPVFDRQQGELARLRLSQRNLNFELISQQNIIRGQVNLAYRKVLNAREIMGKYQNSVIAQSEKVAELGRLSYRLGQTDITSALNAQQANIQVRNTYLTQIMNYEQSYTELEQAVGHVIQ
jgi:outer membrane protein, heavy metal efflux system